MTIILRDYQQKIINQTHDALRRVRKVCLVAPTGSGKRMIATWWCLKIAEKGRRVLVVTNRRLLVEQMGNECKAAGVEHGILMGNETRNDTAPIQIASIATLKRRQWKDMPQADWIIVDEAHLDVDSYNQLFALHPNCKIVGLTATPVGPSGASLLGRYYDEIVEPIKNTELISKKMLLPTRVFAPSEPNVDGVKIEYDSGEYNQEQLGEAVETCTSFADVFKAWEPFSHMQTLLFAPRVKYAYGLCEQFKERGIVAEVIEGGTRQSVRKTTLDLFTKSQARVLCSCEVLSTGFDKTIAQCGIDLQPNNQFRSFWQKIGRVKRPHEGQEYAVWIDMAGNVWKHLHPDSDFDWNLVEGDITTGDVTATKKGKKCPKCQSDNIYKGVCQQCGFKLNQNDAWACPGCAYQLSPWERLTNEGACPNCGMAVGKVKRQIRMGNGVLREIKETEVKKHVTKTNDQKLWDRCRYIAMHTNKTLNFARWKFHKECGHWPDSKTCDCPEFNSGDWKRKPLDVYPYMKQSTKV